MVWVVSKSLACPNPQQSYIFSFEVLHTSSVIFDICSLILLQGLIGKLGSSKSDLIPLHIGLIVPHSFYQERNYIKAVGNSINEISPDRSPTGRRKKGQFTFFEKYSLGVKQILRIMMTVNPSPTSKSTDLISLKVNVPKFFGLFFTKIFFSQRPYLLRSKTEFFSPKGSGTGCSLALIASSKCWVKLRRLHFFPARIEFLETNVFNNGNDCPLGEEVINARYSIPTSLPSQCVEQ